MFWYIVIGVVIVGMILFCFGDTKNRTTKKSHSEKVDQDLQDLAYMDDLLNSKKQKKNNDDSQNVSPKCPFCNNPYYECTCEHSGENKEKISQRFLDEE